MKPLALLAAAMAFTVTAYPTEDLSPRSGHAQALQAALEPVMDALSALDTAVKALSPNPSSAVGLVNAAQQAQGAIEDATTQIQGSQNVGLIGSLALQQTGGQLASQVQQTVDDLLVQKPVVDQLGLTGAAVQVLQQQKAASDELSAALVSKVPSLLQSIAAQSTGQIASTLAMGIAQLSTGGTTTAAPPTTSMVVIAPGRAVG